MGLEQLAEGALIALTPLNLAFAVLGVSIGILVGAMPGLGPTMAIAVMVPITFQLEPASGLIMLVGVFAGAVYGGAITAIMLGIPGTGAAIPTMWEGQPMAQRGEGKRALAISVIASAIGGTMSAIALLVAAPLLAEIALSFGPPEYVALAVLGLGIIVSLEAESLLRGLISMSLGLLVASIGTDPMTGSQRLTGGELSLTDGVPLIAVLIGIFAIPEVVKLATTDRQVPRLERGGAASRPLQRGDARLIAPAIGRGGLIGVLIGVLPGAGGVISTFVAYNDRRRISKHPERFGHGDPQGLASTESANNGSVQASLVPLLTLGIPGSATAAVFLGALTIHGLRPGPFIFSDGGGAIAAFLVGAVLVQGWLLLLGWFGAPLFARGATAHKAFVVPTIVVFSVLGAYGIGSDTFAVWVMVAAGALGVVMNRYRLSTGAFVLALILAPILERNAARTLQLGQGDLTLFVSRPMTIVVYILAMITIFGPLVRRGRQRRRGGSTPPGAESPTDSDTGSGEGSDEPAGHRDGRA